MTIDGSAEVPAEAPIDDSAETSDDAPVDALADIPTETPVVASGPGSQHRVPQLAVKRD